jgi:glycosyltransferase involved in cell wall biosynthesis
MSDLKRINLLVDAHVFDGEFQGSRTYIKEVYMQLINDESFNFYFAANNIENVQKEFGDRKNVFYLKLKSKSSFKRLLIEFPSLIRKYKFDYSHFQYIVPPIKLGKYVVTTHDVIFLDYPEEFSFAYRASKYIMFKFSVLKADVLTTVSEYSKKSIAKFFNTDPAKISVVSNAVDKKYFESISIDESREYIASKYGLSNYILFVSRIEPRKNHAMIIRAFRELALYEKGYKLVFIGKESIPCKEYHRELDLLNEVDKTGLIHLDGISNGDLIKFYSAAQLTVYPSKCEGFGIPPLESAAMEVPTLCANASAMMEFDFFNESLFDPNDYEAFKKLLSDRLEHPLPQSILHTYRDEISKRYSWAKSASKLGEIIKKNYQKN